MHKLTLRLHKLGFVAPRKGPKDESLRVFLSAQKQHQGWFYRWLLDSVIYKSTVRHRLAVDEEVFRDTNTRVGTIFSY